MGGTRWGTLADSEEVSSPNLASNSLAKNEINSGSTICVVQREGIGPNGCWENFLLDPDAKPILLQTKIGKIKKYSPQTTSRVGRWSFPALNCLLEARSCQTVGCESIPPSTREAWCTLLLKIENTWQVRMLRHHIEQAPLSPCTQNSTAQPDSSRYEEVKTDLVPPIPATN